MSTTKQETLKYNPGFGNHFATEALPDALPKDQNSPQKCAYGLYAEQFSGTAFTAPRHQNQRSWMYRIRPSVCHSPYKSIDHPTFRTKVSDMVINPSQLRWDPIPFPAQSEQIDFVDGLMRICGAGDEGAKKGVCIYNYSCNKSMGKRAFQNSDGDFLIVLQHGRLNIKTEFGVISAEPTEIVVIQRGMKFTVDIDEPSKGYILESLTGHFELPGLGPIGANGLANPRDFETPVAWFEDVDDSFTVVNKFVGELFEAEMSYSPYNVVAWHGNYAPYKYNLKKFNTMNSVSFDHPDPSIYTVLTCPSDVPGTATVDFVIFPERWMVMDKSFRPPYYHRNTMTEYMGMIYGEYDGKKANEFQPGGASLHSCMTAHGPDSTTFLKASNADLKPQYFGGGLAFMFETSAVLKLNPISLNQKKREGALENMYPSLQEDYMKCWRSLPKIFNGKIDVAFPSA